MSGAEPAYKTPPSDSMGGLGSIFISNLATRIVGFVGQIAMGWLLLPNDFGIYALALSFTTAIGALRGGGTTQIMIKRGEQFAVEAPLFYRYSLAFNILAMLLLAMFATPYVLNSSSTGVVLLGTALSIPLGTRASIGRAKLTVDHHFSVLAKVNFRAAVVWQISVVTLALFDWGAAAFGVAPLLQVIYENIALRPQTQSLGLAKPTHWPKGSLYALFREGRWMMLSAAMLALATSGHYFAVSIFAERSTVGIFFFAYQLVVALATPLYGAIESVVPSLLTRIDEDFIRQRHAFSRAINWICVATIPGSALIALLSPALIHIAWQGKWDVAIPIVQMLCACVPAWLLVGAARSLIEAKGFWRLRFLTVSTYAVGGVAAASIGAANGDLVLIAILVSGFYVCFAFAMLILLRTLSLATNESLGILASSTVLTTVSIGIASIASQYVGKEFPSLIVVAATATTFTVLSVATNYLFLRGTWKEMTITLLARFEKRRSTAAEAS